MHIPDGYLSPQTCAVSYAAALPFWIAASRKLNKNLRVRQVPYLALSAAFAFVIMMFNIPFFGTTGHAVGAVLVAVLLGPWAACIAVSVALILQALFFGDGGITCIGANCLNMAVVMPFVGYGVYKVIAGNSDARSPRRWIGAAVGGYAGLNAAALVTGIMFGIQPMLYHSAAGRALYSPYPLSAAVPAILGVHLLVFGFVEAAVTGAVVAYIQQTDPALVFGAELNPEVRRRQTPILARIFLFIAVLVVLSPLGLILPAKLGAGTAWGEWSKDEVKHLVGYVPSGMSKLSEVWKSPLPDYAMNGQENASLKTQSTSYVLSAILGVAVVLVIAAAAGRALARNGKS
ncbi:MAG TPA: cobalt transporter CbiM [Armatimonadota bacterium]